MTFLNGVEFCGRWGDGALGMLFVWGLPLVGYGVCVFI